MATKPKKRNKKITLDEFKAWLDGISEMHPQNWVPTLEQWTAIKEKINLITLTEQPQKKKITFDDLDEELKKMIVNLQQPIQSPPPYVPNQEINPYINPIITYQNQEEIIQTAISDNAGGIEGGEVQTGDIQQGPYKSDFI